MIRTYRIHEENAAQEFGMACQRLVPWAGQDEEPPFGAMACFLSAGDRSAPDCHDQDEVMITLGGRGTVDVGEESAAIDAGTVLVIPRNQAHVVHNLGDTGLSWVSFYWPLHEPKNGEEA
ncbi:MULTISPECIES: cupin domain-containing protein [Streptomyces]|uniref:cupin domain-containing protein n=1 Tax=Streptomyces TaxID=1883 RepID=UPI00287FD9FE|nr:cupin domain-containing protein [Streptomyces sp. CGMCC 4.1456]WNF66405.1 cupin domain-containing protein [Streptomyces sp. CGMCC 4.1456]